MEFIKYQGFKDRFIGLVQEDNQYFLIYCKTAPVELSITEDQQEIYYHNAVIGSLTSSKNYNIKIPLFTNNDKIIHIISLPNKESYQTIVTILEDLL